MERRSDPVGTKTLIEEAMGLWRLEASTGTWKILDWRNNRRDQVGGQSPIVQILKIFSVIFRFNDLLSNGERLRHQDVIGQIEGVQPANPAQQKYDDKQQPCSPLNIRDSEHNVTISTPCLSFVKRLRTQLSYHPTVRLPFHLSS